MLSAGLGPSAYQRGVDLPQAPRAAKRHRRPPGREHERRVPDGRDGLREGGLPPLRGVGVRGILVHYEDIEPEKAGRRPRRALAARKLLGWPRTCKLAHACLWECIDKRLHLAQLLGQSGIFLTCCCSKRRSDARSSSNTNVHACEAKTLASPTPFSPGQGCCCHHTSRRSELYRGRKESVWMAADDR